MESFFIEDELWHNTKFKPQVKTIFEAYSDKENGGSGNNEPVCIISQYGKGRCFYNILGHDENTIGIIYVGSQAHMTFQTIDVTNIIEE